MLCEFEIFGVCGICLVVVRRLSRKNSCMWHYSSFCDLWSTLASLEIVNEWNRGLKFISMLAIFKFCSTQFLLINTGRMHLANLRLLLVINIIILPSLHDFAGVVKKPCLTGRAMFVICNFRTNVAKRLVWGEIFVILSTERSRVGVKGGGGGGNGGYEEVATNHIKCTQRGILTWDKTTYWEGKLIFFTKCWYLRRINTNPFVCLYLYIRIYNFQISCYC